jgi:hypothetical protein
MSIKKVDTFYLQRVLEDEATLHWERDIIENIILDIDRYGDIMGYKHDPVDIIQGLDRIKDAIDMDLKDFYTQPELELDFNKEESDNET